MQAPFDPCASPNYCNHSSRRCEAAGILGAPCGGPYPDKQVPPTCNEGLVCFFAGPHELQCRPPAAIGEPCYAPEKYDDRTADRRPSKHDRTWICQEDLWCHVEPACADKPSEAGCEPACRAPGRVGDSCTDLSAEGEPAFGYGAPCELGLICRDNRCSEPA
jgi:hypothetical protein